jgi:predicted DNA-binding transcriptional regulator YafY
LRDTKVPPMLGMDVETALVYQLLERFLEPLLPRVLWARLLPQFARAREQLQTHSSAGLAQWNHRVAVDPGTQPLMQPPLDGKTLGAVNSALLESRQLAFDYRRAGADRTAPPKHHVVAPYGLVLRGQTLYLIARPTLGRQSSDPLAFALHRMTEAKVTAARAIVPPTFNLERDVAAAGAIGIQQGAPIRLELRVTPWWAEFLSESRLSDDQVIAQIRGSDDRRVTATVANTEQLCWWLLSLGREVEVLKPAKLRRKMADETAASARRYKVRDRRVGRD